MIGMMELQQWLQPLKMMLVLLTSFKLLVAQDVVVTAQGRVRGAQQDGYTSYAGIPYATVKEEAGRFKRAGLAPFWLGIREAPASNCLQTSQVEECLRLDINVPTTGSANWPVFVWVRSSPGQYHPRKLVQQGVIVVVVYHRLGPVGFVCLKEDGIPGNVGAKDVMSALRWLQDNIVAFRGNPSKVIVAGQGFGAAVIEAVMLSPASQGLFHGVILQSGTALSPLSFNYDAEERAKILATMLSDNNDAASVLLQANIADLVGKSQELDRPYYPFGLCVEQAMKGEERLLSEPPFDLLSNKKVISVPMIVGYNSNEGYIFVSNLLGERILRRVSQDISFLVPDELKFLNNRERDHVARQIQDMYFKNNLTMASVLAYYRDAYFLNHIYRSVNLHVSSSEHPIYFYELSYAGGAGIQPEPGVKKTGAAHSDDLAYLFSGLDFGGDDGLVQQKIVKLWTNFAKYLTPTPRVGDSSTWDSAELHNPRLLNIDTELRMEQFPHTKAMHMWDDIYDKYYYSRYRTKS